MKNHQLNKPMPVTNEATLHLCVGIKCFCKGSPVCRRGHIPSVTAEGFPICDRCHLMLDTFPAELR